MTWEEMLRRKKLNIKKSLLSNNHILQILYFNRTDVFLINDYTHANETLLQSEDLSLNLF